MENQSKQELAFEEWKVRELSRVRKEKEEREKAIKVGCWADGSYHELPCTYGVYTEPAVSYKLWKDVHISFVLERRYLQEREDTMRRRNMTNDERRMEDMMLGKHIAKDKDKIKFMQKYYHKGAFYMVSDRRLKPHKVKKIAHASKYDLHNVDLCTKQAWLTSPVWCLIFDWYSFWPAKLIDEM